MQDELFTELTAQRAGVDLARAEALSNATLQALAEHVDTAELAKLTAQLPKNLKAAATPTHPHGTYETSLGEFSYRVGELAGAAGPDGTDESRHLPGYVQAVFGVLAEATDEEELGPVLDQLPEEFRTLVPSHSDRGDPGAFFTEVARRADLPDPGEARTATGVSLNLLADRISTGKARDLSSALPEDLRTYLATHKKTPQSFDKDTMLERVITATGAADQQAAQRQVRAVFTTLRGWISESQLDDTLAELPPEIGELFH